MLIQLVGLKNYQSGVLYKIKGENLISLLYFLTKKKSEIFFLTLFHYMISPASSDAVSAD